MKKALSAIVVLLAAACAPMVASGADVIDGRECSMTFIGGRVVQVNPGAGANSDRLAVCVSDGTSANGAELYVGGELNPEQATSGEGFCGAVILFDRTVRGTPDWDRYTSGKDPLNPADDVHLTCD
jgi:hypothetical protein